MSGRELAHLLKRTSLSAIISASRLVANRLDFLQGLDYLVFSPDTKAVLLERQQLHKIIEHETWVFGEEFALTASDKSLTEVLKKHLGILRPDELQVVRRGDKSKGIVDLMLSRTIPQSRAEQRERLIIELKRPTKKIDGTVLNQVESYAHAVAEDERFRDTKTRWIFWAVSNEMDTDARRRTHQSDRPEGMSFVDHDTRIEVWAKTWGQLIQDCRARLNLFQQSLQYTADEESALEYVRGLYQQYLPSPALGQAS